MEIVHQASRRTWIDDKVINVREFVDEFSSHLESLDDSQCLENTVTAEEFARIEKLCGLDDEEVVDKRDILSIPDEELHLKSLKARKKYLEKMKSDPKFARAQYDRKKKYKNFLHRKKPIQNLNHLEPLPVNVPEAVLSVQIYNPERWIDRRVVDYARTPRFRVTQEFLVLGCQYLTELREVIECSSDRTIPGEYSESPASLPTETCKDIYKSGFFYFNGVFYNDMRDKDCRDYSETIIKWSKNRSIGPFKKALMEETRFIDLSVQLGYPYVYIHQGDCEHLVVFTNLSLFSHHDVNNRNAYPLWTEVKTLKRILCMVCRRYTSQWIVYGNMNLPENPYILCNECFYSYHYDKNGRKIGEFQAYHYPDRTMCF